MWTSIAFKAVSFFLPKIAQWIFDWIESALALVQAAQSIPDEASRRERVLASLEAKTGGYLPDTMLVVLMELSVILLRLGVTPESLDEMERLLLAGDTSITQAEVINKFGTLFPDMPERAVRLIFDFALMKIGWR